MISAISTDSSEVVSTSVPMSIPLMIRHSHAKTISAHSHAKTISAMMGQQNLDDGVLVHDFNSFFIHHTRFFRNCKLGVGFIRRG